MNYICEICKTRARQGLVLLMVAHKVTVNPYRTNVENRVSS